MLSILIFSVMVTRAFPFQSQVKRFMTKSAIQATSLRASERVVLSPLPRLYVYDHCPFCVRVRLAFGLKNIKHELRFLANDDIETPTALVGKKIAPIFEMPSKGFAMPESLDIISKVDSDPLFGPTGFFRPMSGRSDLKNWQSAFADTNRIMQRYFETFFHIIFIALY